MHFALYQLRRGRGDLAGARAALADLRGQLRASEPFADVVQALEQELAGDLDGALATLEALRARPDVDAARLSELRWHRNMGRLCFAAGDLARAEGFLRAAVREAPDDASSHAALAALYVRRFQDGERTEAVLAQAAAAGDEAWRYAPSLSEGAFPRAIARIELFGLEPEDTDPATSAAHRAAREALDAAPAGAANSAPWRALAARLLVLEARRPLALRDYERAAELCGSALEADADNLQAAALLAQCCWRLKRFDEGLAVGQHALELWEDPERRGSNDAHWLGVVLAWTLGNAAALGDAATLADARERFVQALAGGAHFGPEELLNAAEFLSSRAPEELRDCALALELIEDHGLRTVFEGGPEAENAASILADIARACP
jgi:tetratricopeptide (TPR) repeat protein